MTQPPPAANNRMATAALVVGILSLPALVTVGGAIAIALALWLLAISTTMERDSAGANATVRPLVAGIA